MINYRNIIGQIEEGKKGRKWKKRKREQIRTRNQCKPGYERWLEEKGKEKEIWERKKRE